MYHYDEYYVTDHSLRALQRYVESGIEPGDFLRSVLENDLKGAVGNADDDNKRNLPAYAAYMYNHMPQQCQGSKEAVIAWLSMHACKNHVGE